MPSKQISALKRLPGEVGLEPVYNALNSLALLNLADGSEKVGEWVRHTASGLTPQQRHTNRVLFEGLREVLSPDRELPDFSAYLEYLTSQNPFVLRDRALARRAPSPWGTARAERSPHPGAVAETPALRRPRPG